MPEVFVPLVGQTVMNIMAPEVELTDVRDAIDGVDQAIATLLAARLRLSRLAIATKAREGVPILDPRREREIKRGYERTARNSAPVARAILCWCREKYED